jgi:F0F1-type ATP synthase epsilon subunit
MFWIAQNSITIFGGHLEIKKTAARILCDFFGQGSEMMCRGFVGRVKSVKGLFSRV